MITNQMLDYIYDTHEHKLLNPNHDILSPANLQTYFTKKKYLFSSLLLHSYLSNCIEVVQSLL